MKNKLLSFWCAHLFPFCNLKKVTDDFKIDGKKFEKISISASEQILNRSIRKENFKALKERGGIKKYLFNWATIFVVSSVLVIEIIKPQTLLERVLTLPILFIPFGMILFLLVFVTFLKEKQDK